MSGAENDRDAAIEEQVDLVLAEFGGDARAAVKALLHDVAILAEDYGDREQGLRAGRGPPPRDQAEGMMVTYAKGVRRPAEIDAEWPWQVEIEVPWNGLGRRLVEITAWLQLHAPTPTSAKRGGATLDATRWCFRDWETAAAFQADFGGELIDAKPARSRRSWPA